MEGEEHESGKEEWERGRKSSEYCVLTNLLQLEQNQKLIKVQHKGFFIFSTKLRNSTIYNNYVSCTNYSC